MPKTEDAICKKRQELYSKINLLKKTKEGSSKESCNLIDKEIKELYRKAARLNGRTFAQRHAGFS